MCMSAQRCVGRPIGPCHADGGMNANMWMAGCRAVDGVYARRHFFGDCCR